MTGPGLPCPRMSGALRRAWEKPPSQFHRWIAEKPLRWVALVAFAALCLAFPSAKNMPHDSLGITIVVALLAVYALAALVGGTLTRRRVRQYDARLE